MRTRDTERQADEEEPTAFEQQVADLLGSVLTTEDRQLLYAFDLIPDAKMRRSLIELANAAAGVGGHDTAADLTPEDVRAVPMRTAGERQIVQLRRVRRLLRRALGKGPAS